MATWGFNRHDDDSDAFWRAACWQAYTLFARTHELLDVLSQVGTLRPKWNRKIANALYTASISGECGMIARFGYVSSFGPGKIRDMELQIDSNGFDVCIHSSSAALHSFTRDESKRLNFNHCLGTCKTIFNGNRFTFDPLTSILSLNPQSEETALMTFVAEGIMGRQYYVGRGMGWRDVTANQVKHI